VLFACILKLDWVEQKKYFSIRNGQIKKKNNACFIENQGKRLKKLATHHRNTRMSLN